MINLLESEYSYSSTQFDIEEPLRGEILNFASSFINPLDLTEDGLEEKSHITIRYGLTDLLPNNVANLALNIKPVKVVLGKTSIFDSSPEFDVVKIDVLSKDLRALNRLFRKELAGEDTYKVFKPHLTLAYVRSGTGEKYIGREDFLGRILIFDHITFSSSNGSKFKIYLNDKL